MNDNKDLKYHSDNNNEYNNTSYNIYNKNIDDTYIDLIDIDFINEECAICHRELIDIKDIWVVNDELIKDYYVDRYLCKKCGKEHGVKIVRCREMD